MPMNISPDDFASTETFTNSQFDVMKTLAHFALLLLALTFATAAARAATPIIALDKAASPLETLAAREVMRYVYQRTGQRLSIRNAAKPPRDSIVVARKDRALLAGVDAATRAQIAALLPQQYLLQTREAAGVRTVWIVGGDDVGTLYGAYRFAEALGVRFYLHGDTLPDRRLAFPLPSVNETGRPLFAVRGIQPFHDFPEGPDWWSRDDYLAIVAQLPKLRMNFIGLHSYPEGSAGPEPAVWIGAPSDMDANGKVNFSSVSRWANTAIPVRWGYQAATTDSFAGGASLLFPGEHYGPEAMAGLLPNPTTPAENNRVFNNAADLLGAAFGQARALGVKTAIGTETPMIIPRVVRERLQQQGQDPDDPATVRAVYRGIFERLKRTAPVDYYWLWTPESWIWGGNKPGQFEATTADIEAALDALGASGNPFTLATSGWVLGPQQDRAALDKVLPKTSPMSSINQFHSYAAVDPALGNITGRPKWAIPWLENDRSLTSPQFWVGRLRYDAADTRRLGGTGLLGIHWRTKVIAPNVAALSQAAWDQSYVPHNFDQTPIQPHSIPVIGSVGGENILGTEPVKGAPLSLIYQSVRAKMDGYNLRVPDGTYTVTLQLSEPTYDAPGQRVFGVKVQGQQVARDLDIFARAGKLTALDLSFPDVRVDDGFLRIEFTRQIGEPVVGGIIIEGTADAPASAPAAPYLRKINSAGGAYAGYEAERPREAPANEQTRAMPVADFYLDFARANFGDSVAARAGAIFAGVDGLKMPTPSEWIKGPGGVQIETAPWPEIARRYQFVDELSALRPQIKGAGNRERFDYWLHTFEAARAMARVGSRRGLLDAAMKAVEAADGAARKRELAAQALALRIELAQDWARLMSLQVAATDTSGELGTLANLEQHSRGWLQLLSAHDDALQKALGAPLPPETQPNQNYDGPARIIVPTARGLAAPGESLTLKVILLSAGQTLPRGTLFWRPLGAGKFRAIPLTHVARRVFRVALPPLSAQQNAIEYYVRADYGGGIQLVYPATAPTLNQSVVVF